MGGKKKKRKMKQDASLVELFGSVGCDHVWRGLIPVCQLCFTHSRACCKGTINTVRALSGGMPCMLADMFL